MKFCHRPVGRSIAPLPLLWSLLCCVAVEVSHATILHSIANVSVSSYGHFTGVATQGLLAGRRCALDGKIPKALNVNATNDPSLLVCSSLPTDHPCSLATLRREILGGSDADDEKSADVDPFLTMNVTLGYPGYNWSENVVGGFPTLQDPQTSAEVVATWFALVRYSKMNVSSNCFCIHQVFLVTSLGRVVQDTSLLGVLQGAPSLEASQAANEVVLSCVFGTGVGVAAPGGVGGAAADRILYDSSSGVLLQFEHVEDIGVQALRLAWSNAAWGDVLNPTFVDNRSATPSLGHWPLVATSSVGSVLMERPSSTLATLWFGRLVFCNINISTLRSITNGVERSSGVLVEVDWSLTDVYAVLPLEMAKAVAIRSTIVDETSCVVTCTDSHTSVGASKEGIAAPPCRYTCALGVRFQPNSSMTAEERRSLDASLHGMVAPLFLEAVGSEGPTRGVQLNTSTFLVKRHVEGFGEANFLSITTWPVFGDDVTPTLLLGGLFLTQKDSTVAKRYVVMDRAYLRIGLSPTTSSVLLSGLTTPKLDAVCLPTPICGDDEVLIVEINRCVNTICSGFFFMEVSPVTGECWLKRTYTIAAGTLFALSVVGESLLTYVVFATTRALCLMQGKIH